MPTLAELKGAPPALLTGSEVAKLMRVSLPTINRMVRDGRLPVTPIRFNGDGKLLRFHSDEFFSWLAAHCPRDWKWQQPQAEAIEVSA